MTDPAELLGSIATTADAYFVWTHVYRVNYHPMAFTAKRVLRLGIELDYWSHHYAPKNKA